MPTDVRRSADRFTTTRPGSVTRHSFSFGHHYDPANVSFGPVVAVNDEVLAPGAGFDEHPHSGLVIVTLVVAGSLAHQGISSAVVGPGQVAVLRTGRGVVHSERNAGGDELRFIQTWIATDSAEVSYGVVDGPIDVGAARVLAGQVPAGPFSGHLFVVSGEATVAGVRLAAGDSVRAVTPADLVPDEGSQAILVTWPALP